MSEQARPRNRRCYTLFEYEQRSKTNSSCIYARRRRASGCGTVGVETLKIEDNFPSGQIFRSTKEKLSVSLTPTRDFVSRRFESRRVLGSSAPTPLPHFFLAPFRRMRADRNLIL